MHMDSLVCSVLHSSASEAFCFRNEFHHLDWSPSMHVLRCIWSIWFRMVSDMHLGWSPLVCYVTYVVMCFKHFSFEWCMDRSSSMFLIVWLIGMVGF
jgi:hypothetical protein